jgi:hypothetical protein
VLETVLFFDGVSVYREKEGQDDGIYSQMPMDRRADLLLDEVRNHPLSSSTTHVTSYSDRVRHLEDDSSILLIVGLSNLSSYFTGCWRHGGGMP